MRAPFASPAPPPAPDPARRGRIAGIDLARALAIIGMFAVHFGPTGQASLAGQVYALPHGRASILFVLVAGIGVSLLASSRRATLAEARVKLAWTALILLPLGLALQELSHYVLVVLQDYALLFVLAIALVGVSGGTLLALAAAFAVLGPLAFLAGQVSDPASFNRAEVSISDAGGEIVHGLVLSGPYPLITWAAPFILGMWLGRRNLRSRSLRTALLVGGAAAALGAYALARLLEAIFGAPLAPPGWDHVITDRPHSQMPLWLIGATGSATLVLGAALFAADALGRLVLPLVAFGQMALTAYVGHILALHWWGRTLRTADVGEAVFTLAAVTISAVALSAAWRQIADRGPLETVLHAPTAAMRRTGPRQIGKASTPPSCRRADPAACRAA